MSHSKPIHESISAQLPVAELSAVAKIENLLAFTVGDNARRLIYPYFSERPILPPEGARLGIWALNSAFREERIEDFRILDVLRGNSYGTIDYTLQGNEGDLFIRRYRDAIDEWNKLKEEY